LSNDRLNHVQPMVRLSVVVRLLGDPFILSIAVVRSAMSIWTYSPETGASSSGHSGPAVPGLLLSLVAKTPTTNSFHAVSPAAVTCPRLLRVQNSAHSPLKRHRNHAMVSHPSHWGCWNLP